VQIPSRFLRESAKVPWGPRRYRQYRGEKPQTKEATMTIDRRTLCFALFALGTVGACAWALAALETLKASLGV